MEQKLTKVVVITNLAIFIFLAAGNIFAQVKAADQTTSKKEKTNHLRVIEKHLPSGIEKDFFLALEKSETEYLDLIEALGLFQYNDIQPIGTVQLPGKKPEPLYIDWAEILRHKLFWETTVIISTDSFRLLFFQETPIHSFRPRVSCVIVSTDINYKIRHWLRSGCYEQFIKASLEKTEDGFFFKIVGKAYSEKGLRLSQYKITADKIAEVLKTN